VAAMRRLARPTARSHITAMSTATKMARSSRGVRSAKTGQVVLTPASKPKNITLQQARKAVREAAVAKG
jgi:hypothetical protein